MGQACMKPHERAHSGAAVHGDRKNTSSSRTREAYDNCPSYRYQPQGDSAGHAADDVAARTQSVVRPQSSNSNPPHVPKIVPPATVVPEAIVEETHDIWVPSVRNKFGCATPRGHRVKELGEKIFHADGTDGIVTTVTRKKGDRVLETTQRGNQGSRGPSGELDLPSPYAGGQLSDTSRSPNPPSRDSAALGVRTDSRCVSAEPPQLSLVRRASERNHTHMTPLNGGVEGKKGVSLLELARASAATTV